MDARTIYEKLYRYCYMKTKHRQTAEDIAQEAILRFLEKHSEREMAHNMPYLYVTAKNLCIDHYRKSRETPIGEPPHAEVEDHASKTEVAITINQAMSTLPEEERELLFLRFTIDLSVNDTAKALGISRFALYRKEKHALKSLRAILDRGDLNE